VTADDPHDGRIPGPPYLTTEELRRDVSALREILQARLDGMDRAAVVLSETVNRTPTDIQTAISHLKELHDERFRSTSLESDERFKSVALQFKERDERSSQLAKTQDEALKAALQSAEKLNEAQGSANKEANAKTEITFAQQLKAVTDKIEVINGRLDRGEGTSAGAADTRTERRLDTAGILQAVVTIAAVITVIIVILKG
jgi:VIT1/CCC1 family predicted Fe2+/Mn2+ transporter